MLLANNGIIPPRYWMHDIDLCDDSYYNRTLKTYLEDRKLPIPRHWSDDDMTIFD